jgi:hypothetical protein
VYGGLVEDEVAVVIPAVLDGVVAGVVELFDCFIQNRGEYLRL